MSNRRRQELYCHNCDKNVQFICDLDLDGNHVLNCPNCGHEHCRVVKDGVITNDRWDQRNGSTYKILTSNITWTNIIAYQASSMTYFLSLSTIT